MLKRIEDDGEVIQFTFDSREIHACRGETVAAALMAAGIREFRGSYVTGQPRAPYCLMGACFECLVRINGTPNVQSCMIEVAAGMDVMRMPVALTELR